MKSICMRFMSLGSLLMFLLLLGCAGPQQSGSSVTAQKPAERAKPEKNPARPTAWKVSILKKKLQVMKENTIPPHPTVLSLRLSLDYSGTGDAVLTKDQIVLKDPNGVPCPLFALGAGKNALNAFNFYAVPGSGWFGGEYAKVDYVDEGETVFGLRIPKGKTAPEVILHKRPTTIVVGFSTPNKSGKYHLTIGDADLEFDAGLS